MIIRKDVDIDIPLTASQRKMLNDMQHRPAQPDKDCPELTPEQMKKMNRKENKELKEFENHKATINVEQNMRLEKLMNMISMEKSIFYLKHDMKEKG